MTAILDPGRMVWNVSGSILSFGVIFGMLTLLFHKCSTPEKDRKVNRTKNSG